MAHRLGVCHFCKANLNIQVALTTSRVWLACLAATMGRFAKFLKKFPNLYRAQDPKVGSSLSLCANQVVLIWGKQERTYLGEKVAKTPVDISSRFGGTAFQQVSLGKAHSVLLTGWQPHILYTNISEDGRVITFGENKEGQVPVAIYYHANCWCSWGLVRRIRRAGIHEK